MDKLILVKTKEQLLELISYLQDKDYISFDTETTGLEQDSLVIGLSVSAEVDKAYYVILSYWDVSHITTSVTDTYEDDDGVSHETAYPKTTTSGKLVHSLGSTDILPLLELLQKKQLIMHNATFDCAMIMNNYRVDLMASLHTDTMILSHVLNENRHNGLKELGISIFGQEATNEQKEMKASVLANGGVLTKDKYELYKASPDLLGKYGAMDALLTLKLFYVFVEQLYNENLDDFFYKDESMPLLRGPTYELNTAGLKVDLHKLNELKKQLEISCAEDKAFILGEISAHVQDKYPGTKPANTFNIGSGKQLAWLLYFQLGEDYSLLTKGGRDLCRCLGQKVPYQPKPRREFIQFLKDNKGRVYEEAKYNYKTKKMSRPKKIGDAWNYIAASKSSLGLLAQKHAFVRKLLEHSKNMKLLNTYVLGIEERERYGVIRTSYLQHGTTSGRYSSRNPNFQNLPRDDKRIKACIVSRSGKVFVGADYSQLEPRTFASFSGDERLLKCFSDGDDFYSIIGMETFDKYDCTAIKDDSPNSFAIKYKKLRDMAKAVALAATYGTSAAQLAMITNKPIDECREIIDSYFTKFPKVKQLQLDSHALAKEHGHVSNLFGRKRRMPEAKNIENIYGDAEHSSLPYNIRNILNLAINHRIQSTGASIINRASIAFYNKIRELGIEECHLVMQVHDELVVECSQKDSEDVAAILKYCMENTVELPGVQLIAKPIIANNLADLK